MLSPKFNLSSRVVTALVHVSNVDLCNCIAISVDLIVFIKKINPFNVTRPGHFPWVVVCVQRQFSGVRKTKTRGTVRSGHPQIGVIINTLTFNWRKYKPANTAAFTLFCDSLMK